jgi:16S rRNA (adenine1518-N6/adenine1519-N6)-dimethyltransferase
LARSLEQLLRRCFASRRKMLRNTLAGLVAPELLAPWAAAAGVGLDQRPQELAPDNWVRLAAGLLGATESEEASTPEPAD